MMENSINELEKFVTKSFSKDICDGKKTSVSNASMIRLVIENIILSLFLSLTIEIR